MLAALGGRYLGPSLQVHAPTLLSRLDSTLARTEVAVFIDEPLPDVATITVIEAMLDQFGSEHALVRAVPATEAVKRLEGRVVAEGIERSSLFSPRPPEVIRVDALLAAAETIGEEQWVSPSAMVVRTGGDARIFDETALADTARR